MLGEQLFGDPQPRQPPVKTFSKLWHLLRSQDYFPRNLILRAVSGYSKVRHMTTLEMTQWADEVTLIDIPRGYGRFEGRIAPLGVFGKPEHLRMGRNVRAGWSFDQMAGLTL
jgi:hypothetical protein